jgi:hypothetical protein
MTSVLGAVLAAVPPSVVPAAVLDQQAVRERAINAASVVAKIFFIHFPPARRAVVFWKLSSC